MPAPKRKPLGQPITRSEAGQEQAAQVTERDIEEAKAFVQRVSPRLAALLEAKEIDASQNKPD